MAARRRPIGAVSAVRSPSRCDDHALADDQAPTATDHPTLEELAILGGGSVASISNARRGKALAQALGAAQTSTRPRLFDRRARRRSSPTSRKTIDAASPRRNRATPALQQRRPRQPHCSAVSAIGELNSSTSAPRCQSPTRRRQYLAPTRSREHASLLPPTATRRSGRGIRSRSSTKKGSNARSPSGLSPGLSAGRRVLARGRRRPRTPKPFALAAASAPGALSRGRRAVRRPGRRGGPGQRARRDAQGALVRVRVLVLSAKARRQASSPRSRPTC